MSEKIPESAVENIDLSQFKLAKVESEADVDEIEDRFRIMADHAPVMIWIADLDKLCTFFNKVWLDFTGRTLEEEYGNGWAEGVHPEDFDRCLATYVASFDARQAFTMEYRLRRFDGEYRWLIDNGIPHYNAQGVFLGYLGSCIDISDRKHAEQLLEKSRQEAEQASQIKSQFLAMMSHEIRTPLNAILGILELFTQTTLDNKQLEYLDIATQASNNLLAIVNDILDLTKVESGMLEMEYINFDVIELTQFCVRLMMGSAKDKGLQLGVFIDPDVNSVICGDPLRFKQVLLNLLNNAIKFTEKGSVIVKLSALPASDSEQTYGVLVEVIDTGIGIPLERQVGLFEVFVQADLSDTRKYGGSGLGLAITKRLVTLWGGQVGLESTPNVGSRFWFSVGIEAIKFKGSSASTPVTPVVNTTSSTTKTALVAKILLVDDSGFNQVVLTSMLEAAGHLVDLAVCGADAIKAVTDKVYDLILMDVSMPDMSGMEATTIIRQMGVADDTPIIAITAHALAGYQEKCLAAGMNHYITKPISQKALLSIVDTWCADGLGQAVNAPSRPLDATLENPDSAFNLDKQVIDDLIEQLGQAKVFELLKLLPLEIADRTAAINQAVIERNIERIGREVHSIKSIAATFGATVLLENALALEGCIYNNNLTMAMALVDEFLKCAESTSVVVRQTSEAAYK